MKREDIIRMAREAGFVVDEKARQHQPNCIFHTHHMVDELLEHFAALVTAAERKRVRSAMKRAFRRMAGLIRADEREACAKVCDDLERAKWESVKNITQNGGRLAFAGPMHCAAAIRARGQS